MTRAGPPGSLSSLPSPAAVRATGDAVEREREERLRTLDALFFEALMLRVQMGMAP